MAECVHAIPGRVRFRVPSLRGDATAADDLRQRLLSLPGVLAVDIRAAAVSVVVRHDPQVLPLAALLTACAATMPPAPAPNAEHMRPQTGPSACRLTPWARKVGTAVGGIAGSYVLERAVKAGVGLLLRSARLPI